MNLTKGVAISFLVIVVLVASTTYLIHTVLGVPLTKEEDCEGYVAITIDDGPNPSTTPALLNILNQKNVPATFFFTGKNAKDNPDLVVATRSAGHDVGNHTYDHQDLTTLTSELAFKEILGTSDVLLGITGEQTRLFRPPFGKTSPDILHTAKRLGMAEVLWDVDTRDHDNRSTTSISYLAKSAQGGSVILVHDGVPNTVTALPTIIDELKSRNLCPGRIHSDNTGKWKVAK